jgi:RNA recognition motif-containing protein
VSQKMYVSNLPFKLTDSDLKAHFEQYGNVISATVINDRDTGKSRGFGFVEMDNADLALSEGNGSLIDGRALNVSPARERAPRENRDRY